MKEHHFYNQRFSVLPQYPLAVLEFLKTELQLGKRYVVMDVHTNNAQLSKLLQKHVHLVCSLTPDAAYHNYLKDKFSNSPNFLSLNSSPEFIPIEDDSMDCICIDDSIQQYNLPQIKQEFERILRLNSYVLYINHQLDGRTGSFTDAYQQFLTTIQNPEASSPLKEENWNAFYNNNYQQKNFPNQQRLNWEELLLFVQDKLGKTALEPTQIKILKGLFDQYQHDDTISLEYKTKLYFGLFNYYVPEISLRKSIFFHALRPFAFGFYVLVKSNIYFWRALYKIKDKLFRNSST